MLTIYFPLVITYLSLLIQYMESKRKDNRYSLFLGHMNFLHFISNTVIFFCTFKYAFFVLYGTSQENQKKISKFFLPPRISANGDFAWRRKMLMAERKTLEK